MRENNRLQSESLRLPEIELGGEKPEPGIWSWCGDAPTSRLVAGEIATTKHGTCHECWYPTPLTALDENQICTSCRGEISFKPFTEAPTKDDYL